MARIELFTGPKGGSGKSFAAVTRTQHMRARGNPPLCIDTDPANGTFSQYMALKVHLFEVMNGEDIDQGLFDDLFEKIAASTDDVIVDTGTSAFYSLMSYLVGTDVPAVLKDMGHKLTIHTSITGGQALLDTVAGLTKLMALFPDTPFVVWLNRFWGPIEMDGKTFYEFKAYLENKKRIAAVIELPELQAQTFGRDLSNMLQNHLTFDEAVNSPELPVFTRQRLRMTRDKLWDLLDNANLG